mmetsp:Transcript_82407/g.265680  ORF Transcript_82407/g.265680 Transcript_82407/m.265680 type:complete len:471 (+) Transcript_82407:55-1467(+)
MERNMCNYKEPLNASSPESYSEDEQEVPFHVPSSEVVFRGYVQSTVAVLSVAAALAAMVYAPKGGVFDPMACIACGYIFGVFCFQNTFVEWPAVPRHILLLLASVLASLLAPTCLEHVGFWATWGVKCVAWAIDVAIVISGYRFMVRGPEYAHLGEGSLEGKTFVITGCNTGIGYETAKTLADAGATVVFACRSEDKALAAMKKIVEECAGQVQEEQLVFVPLDTSSFESVRRFAGLMEKTGHKPQTLILNAGVMLSNRSLSKDGLEMTMATNHFGHFLLVQQLLPGLLAAEGLGEKPRIVIVGSNMSYLHDRFDFRELEVVSGDEKAKQLYMEKPYGLFRAYGQSKLANLHFTTELARRLQAKGSKIPVNQIHPGEVLTDVMRDMHPVVVKLKEIFRPVAMGFMKTPTQGAFCTLHVATDPALSTSDNITGAHFVRCSPAPLSRAGSDEKVADRLWTISERVTNEVSVV